MIVAPGAYDCLTAKLIAHTGFKAVYMTGAGTAAALRGFPDYGLPTLTDIDVVKQEFQVGRKKEFWD